MSTVRFTAPIGKKDPIATLATCTRSTLLCQAPLNHYHGSVLCCHRIPQWITKEGMASRWLCEVLSRKAYSTCHCGSAHHSSRCSLHNSPPSLAVDRPRFKVEKQLKDKHKKTYTMPQLRLWARMSNCGTHDGYDIPPAVPMFSTTQPKKLQEENCWQTQLQKVLYGTV